MSIIPKDHNREVAGRIVADQSSPHGEPSQPSSEPNESGLPEAEVSQKRKRRYSEVWQHFEHMTIGGKDKARCLHCNQRLSANSKGGTSHLWDHYNVRCTKKHVKLDLRQQSLSFNTSKSENKARLENYNFSQDISRKELANMVAMHEYPLSIVDHVGFRRFVTSLNPNFKLVTRNTLKSDLMKMFATNKGVIKKMFEKHNGRIAITTDMWTATHQKKGYMAVTAHFIDDEWVLHNRTLRFAYVPCPHTKEVLAQVLMESLDTYNLAEKISVVVLDNCSTNDAMMEILREKLDS